MKQLIVYKLLISFALISCIGAGKKANGDAALHAAKQVNLQWMFEFYKAFP